MIFVNGDRKPDKSRLDELVHEAVEKVKKKAEKYADEHDGAPIPWCWSGGKDSQALRVVVELSEVKALPIMFTPGCDLHFPGFNNWAKGAAPNGLVEKLKAHNA